MLEKRPKVDLHGLWIIAVPEKLAQHVQENWTPKGRNHVTLLITTS